MFANSQINIHRRDAYHEKNGILIPEADPHALAKQYINLINDKNRIRKLGIEAKKTVDETFSFLEKKIKSKRKKILDRNVLRNDVKILFETGDFEEGTVTMDTIIKDGKQIIIKEVKKIKKED